MIKKISLDQPLRYEIKVPGALDKEALGWNGGMQITIESGGINDPISTLTIIVDQAALQGLLRHLYSLGLSLLSVICVECI